MALSVEEHVSEPGSAARPNEDRLGWTEAGAFVIDGATGLSDAPVMAPEEGPTDAAWLAAFAADRLTDGLAAAADLRDAIRAVSRAARDAFRGRPGGGAAPRYAWPSAAIQLLRTTADGGVETAGLGDCRLILLDAAGAVFDASGPQFDRGREQAAARAALERKGGFAAIATDRDPETLALLRASRERQNTPGGYWTLGLVPEAANQASVARFAPRPPARGLLMTDGFADLIDLFGAYDARGLIEAAFERGLDGLASELRRFERVVDPEGARYPRFKQSDDATAISFRLS